MNLDVLAYIIIIAAGLSILGACASLVYVEYKENNYAPILIISLFASALSIYWAMERVI